MKLKQTKTNAWLFGINLFISTFTFGGGYVVIPMIRKYFVQKKKLFTESQLMDMAAIAQSSPGAIAVNLSVLAGYRVSGLPGAVISCIAAVLPPLIILSIISLGYEAFRDSQLVSAILKGMEAGVAALIVDLVIDMCSAVFRDRNRFLTLLVPLSFGACFFLKINVLIVILSCMMLCLLESVYRKRKKGATEC